MSNELFKKKKRTSIKARLFFIETKTSAQLQEIYDEIPCEIKVRLVIFVA